MLPELKKIADTESNFVPAIRKAKIFKDVANALFNQPDDFNYPDAPSMIEDILDSFKLIMKGLPITQINLNNNTLFDDKGHYIRFPAIIRNELGTFNKNAWHIIIRKYYSHTKSAQVPGEEINLHTSVPIYINKGGIITGEYFDTAEIKEELFDNFLVEFIYIPTSQIYYNDGEIDNILYAVDHRDPSLRKLKEKYIIPIKEDNVVKSLKLNIRKYKKL